MFRTLSVVCAVAAAGLLGWAGYVALYPPAEELTPSLPVGPPQEPAGLTVDGAEQDVGERPVGESAVSFRLTNRSGRAAELIGLPAGCGPTCCFAPRQPVRMPVPPGEMVEVAGELDVRQPGPFKFEGALFLNDGGRLRTVRVKLTGVGVEPKREKPHAPPP